MKRETGRIATALGCLLLLGSCGGGAAGPGGSSDDSGIPGRQLSCSISAAEIFSGGPGKDGIPALSNPDFAPAGQPGTEYLRASDRVVGFLVGPEAFAVPLNVFWWHEIVNFDRPGVSWAVTHCPLTGSSMAFERAPADHAAFGVSGLLYRNNLVMYDRNDEESLWPQMLAAARCGSRDGTGLPMVPVLETTWEGWLSLHPDTKVVTSDTGYDRDYRLYPYGDYDRRDNPETLFPTTKPDYSRPPKERGLGIGRGEEAIVFPFGVLDALGPLGAARAQVDGEAVTVLWDRERWAAMAYRTGSLDLDVVGGAFVDRQTGSTWRIDGLAVDGPSAGSRLEPVEDAYVAFWFAWAEFFSDIEIWEQA